MPPSQDKLEGETKVIGCDPKPYLEYLDKEMGIMGLLSTFSVLVIGLTVNASLEANRGELQNVWPLGHWYLLGGSFWMLVAALLFYRQRSLLAYYYGQIALCSVQGSSGEYSKLNDVLADADAWITWFFYQTAFACLIAGFASYGAALLATVMPLLRCPSANIIFTLIAIALVGGFSLWNYLRLRTIDEEPKARRRSGWVAKPSETVRKRNDRTA